MTPEQEKDQLENERFTGNKASQSYNQFIRGFVEDKRKVLFEAFRDLPLTADVEIMEVKRMLYAVDTLEQDLLNIIDTGKMASKTLSDRESQNEEGVTH